MRVALFGRKVPLATDDFLWPAIQGMLINASVALTGAILLIVCKYQWYPALALGTASATLCINIGLFHKTSQGTVQHSEHRQGVSRYVYALFGAHVISIGCHTYGLAYAFSVDQCGSLVQKMVAISMLWYFIMVGLFYVLLFYNSVTKRDRGIESKTQRLQEFLGSLLRQKDRQTLHDSARVFMSEVQRSGIDVAPSDILVGLILLRKVQTRKTWEPKPVEGSVLEQCLFFVQHVRLAYSFPFRDYAKVSGKSRVKWGNEEKGTLLLPLSRVEQRVGSECLLASKANGLFELPFYLMLNHRKKLIVVTVRGTQSLTDVVTDLHSRGIPIEVDGKRTSTHSGMYFTAMNIFSAMSQRFQYALETYPSYQVYITGHSLGGGVACLITHMIRITMYSDAQCITYSTPGFIATRESIPYFERFCITVTLERDFAPRCSAQNLKKLSHSLTVLIANCSYKKTQVLMDRAEASPEAIRAMRERADVEQETFVPGRIICLYRCHDSYAATWIQASDLDQILISKYMISDHLTNNTKIALESILSSS